MTGRIYHLVYSRHFKSNILSKPCTDIPLTHLFPYFYAVCTPNLLSESLATDLSFQWHVSREDKLLFSFRDS